MKKLNEVKLEDSKKLRLKIVYGNKHELVPDANKYYILLISRSNSDKSKTNKHKWTAFVKVEHEKVKSKDIIESVTFELHETFRNPVRKVSASPYEVKQISLIK